MTRLTRTWSLPSHAGCDPGNVSTLPPPERALAGRRNAVEVYYRDFDTARLYAAARDWWLHAWTWRTDQDAPMSRSRSEPRRPAAADRAAVTTLGRQVATS